MGAVQLADCRLPMTENEMGSTSLIVHSHQSPRVNRDEGMPSRANPFLNLEIWPQLAIFGNPSLIAPPSQHNQAAFVLLEAEASAKYIAFYLVRNCSSRDSRPAETKRVCGEAEMEP